MRAELVEHPARWAELQKPWDALCDRSADPNPFVRHAWIDAWRKAFAPKAALKCFLYWRSGKLTCALPFICDPEHPRRWHSPFNHFAARCDPPVDPAYAEDLEALVAAVHGQRRSWSTIYLPELSEPSALGRLLVGEAPSFLGVFGTKTIASPVLDTSMGDYEAHLKRQFSGKTRQGLRRKKRKAEKLGLAFHHHQDEDTIGARWASVLAAEDASWKGDEGSSMLASPGAAQFVEAITRDAARRNKAHLFTLELGEQVAGFLLGYLEAGVFYFHKTGFDVAHAQASPGKLVLFEAIEHAFSNSEITSFDFLGAPDPYKTEHTETLRSHVSLHLGHRGRRSLALLWERRARHFVSSHRKNRQHFELAVDHHPGRG